MTHLWGCLWGEPGGEEAGDIAGVAGAEAARLLEYSVPPTAIAVPPPIGSVMRVMLIPDVDREGREVANEMASSFKSNYLFIQY